MSWILPEGAWLQFEGLSIPLQVIRGIGGGTQGQVYEVELGGERLALKWYLPSCIEQDPGLEQRLRESITATAPNADFLWPIALLRPTAETQPLIRSRQVGFGYLMNLRPANFVGAVEHYASRIEITISQVIQAAFHLANAFHALHSKGLCYKDISLGNLFLDPGSGRILICDNDNVDVDGRGLGSVLGTPGFMAPEILMRKARPGANSDLFSLAVLIFRLLTRHDPLKGQMELEIRCLDEPARRRLYGEDPVFIFDPRDQRNRPDPQLHSAALITWPIYPSELQNLFLQTFGEGMHNPARRALTGQWREVLARTLDQRRRCTGCGQETFAAGPGCWNCGTPIPTGPAMVTDHARVAICAENQLHPHHFNRLEPPELDHPIAQVVSHPTDPELLGLRNLSDAPWRATLSNGSQVGVQPKQSCNLAILEHLQTPLGSVRMERTTR